MTRFGALVLAACAVACDSQSARAAVPTDDLLIRNVSIVSPERYAPSDITHVLVRNGRIAAIGGQLADTSGIPHRVIDGAGRYLIPGFVDGHTHLAAIPGMSSQDAARYADVARAARRQIPLSYLYHGFTTVIDLDSDSEVIGQWNARDLRPQAHFCAAPPDMVAGTAESVVARIQSEGAICVTLRHEPGSTRRSDRQEEAHILRARELVGAARSRGMPVLLHASSQSAYAFGLAAGVDGVARGMWGWDEARPGRSGDVTAVLNELIDRRIVWQPTIQVLYGERDLHDPAYLERPALVDVLPASLLHWYASDDGQAYRERRRAPAQIERLEAAGRSWQDVNAEPIARATTALVYVAAHGGRLIFGSATPGGPSYANPPGLNGLLEMRNWLAAGIEPDRIFRAATVDTAKFFGLGDVGTIEVGKRADLLLLRPNPLRDAAAFDQIDVVILGGRAIPRLELSAAIATFDGRR